MIRKAVIGAAFLFVCMSMSALEITRYVSPIGSGDGMTPENPTSDLGAMLSLGAKVDRLTLNVAPGFYPLHFDSDAGGVTFNNIILDGSWNDDGTSDMVHIDYHGINFVNSSIYKVSFGGSVTIQGGMMMNCVAENGQLRAILGNGNCAFYNCKCKGFVAENWNYGNNDKVYLQSCSAKAGKYGFQGSHLNELYVYDSQFDDNKAGGCNIDGCKMANFSDCTFNMNEGDGALRLIEFDNSGTATFERCEFTGNEVTHNHEHNIYVHSNVSFYDCLFVANTEKDIDHKGIVHLGRPDFSFVNCTFIDNWSGAISLDSFYPSSYQIVNCAFWNNRKGNIYAGGREDVPLLSCAMDHGTGIPELDAEKGIILLTEANKGFRYNGMALEVEPNSVLINRGVSRPIENTDKQKHPRNAFGGTDIGCTEYISAPGVWQPDSLVLKVDEFSYQLCKAMVGGVNYYALFPEAVATSGSPQIEDFRTDFIYLDTMPAAPKVLGGKYVERHLSDGKGGYIIDVLSRNNREWLVKDGMSYRSAKDRPTVKIVDSQVKFIKPTAANRPASAKAGTAGKRPASKSRR